MSQPLNTGWLSCNICRKLFESHSRFQTHLAVHGAKYNLSESPRNAPSKETQFRSRPNTESAARTTTRKATTASKIRTEEPAQDEKDRLDFSRQLAGKNPLAAKCLGGTQLTKYKAQGSKSSWGTPKKRRP
jgi:hypothetical protein